MPERFDPYHKWLGIRANERPITHYRLLGIAHLEEDPEVISNAADQRMATLKTYQAGKYSQLSQKLLNEVAKARVCLLNAERKSHYDERLRDSDWPPETKVSQPQHTDDLATSGSTSCPAMSLQVDSQVASELAEVSSRLESTIAANDSDQLFPLVFSSAFEKIDQPGSRRNHYRNYWTAYLLLSLAVAVVFGLIVQLNRTAIIRQQFVTAVSPQPSAMQPAVENPTTALPSRDIPEPPQKPTASVPDRAESERPKDRQPVAPKQSSPAVAETKTEIVATAPPDKIQMLPKDGLLSALGQADNQNDQLDPPPAQDVGPKLDVPSEAEQQRARKQIEELRAFADDWLKARSVDRREKSKAAARFAQIAQETEDDAAARYTLLSLSIELLSEAHDFPSSFRWLQLLESDYNVDGLGMRIEVLTRIANQICSQQESRGASQVIAACKQCAQAALDTVELANQADRPPEMERLLTLARQVADYSNDDSLKSSIEQRISVLQVTRVTTIKQPPQ